VYRIIGEYQPRVFQHGKDPNGPVVRYSSHDGYIIEVDNRTIPNTLPNRMWVTTSELACSELFVDTIGLFFIVAIDSAHRVTYTYILYDAPMRHGGQSTYRKVRQFWHWYICNSCGDEWEMYREDINYPKKDFWCPCCRARGETPTSNPN